MFVHNMIDVCQFQLLENYPEQAEILNEAGKQDGFSYNIQQPPISDATTPFIYWHSTMQWC